MIKEESDYMTNFNFQGKIIRHFWGKLIRQSTMRKINTSIRLQYVTWGGVRLPEW